MEDVGSMLPAVTQVGIQVNKAAERLQDLVLSEIRLINIYLQEDMIQDNRVAVIARRVALSGILRTLEEVEL